ncbi:MAG: hypothetical protein GYA33_07550, partial [Thermogutta sp.]|nr:hypothetical protein [Thermogutta sp.]
MRSFRSFAAGGRSAKAGAVSPRPRGWRKAGGSRRRSRGGRFRPACEALEARCLLSAQAWPTLPLGPAPDAGTYSGLAAATVLTASASSGGECSVGLSRVLGGPDWDEITAATRDAQGNIIVCGHTWSADFISGGFDAFVAKLTASGELLWATYLGGEDDGDDDAAMGVAVDAQDNIIVAGYTRSSGWVSGGYDTSYGGAGDGFVAKISPQGDHLWSTYLGGSAYDGVEAVVCDADGNIYTAGTTGSSGWGLGGFDPGYNGGTFDGFLAKLSPNGARLWASFVGGDAWDTASDLALTPDGGLVVVGKASSSDWIAGGSQTAYLGGGFDAYALKATADGQRLWSTYLGGSGEDAAVSVAVNADGRIIIAGETASAAWPAGITSGAYGGGKDVFLTALAGDGDSVLWTTLLGGAGDEQSGRLFTDASGGGYLAGTTSSPGWCSGGLDDVLDGTDDGFLVRFDPSGATEWSTYLGGGGLDYARAAVDGGDGSLLIVGGTASPDWPLLNPEEDLQGERDGFLLRLDLPRPTSLEDLGTIDFLLVPDLAMGTAG